MFYHKKVREYIKSIEYHKRFRWGSPFIWFSISEIKIDQQKFFTEEPIGQAKRIELADSKDMHWVPQYKNISSHYICRRLFLGILLSYRVNKGN